MKRIIKRIRDFLKFRICPKCGSWHMQYSSSWIGGFNKYCQQATNRSGYRCYDCGYIKWTQTDEEYKKGLPTYCDAYC